MAEELSATLQDYLGTIHRLQKEKRFARVRDIAQELGVVKSAVSTALRSLAEKGLIHYETYEPVTLTESGNEVAEHLYFRYRVIHDFLQNVLDLEPEKAAEVAHEMDHAVDDKALDRFTCFLAFLSTEAENGKSWLKQFRKFMQEGAAGNSCRQCIQEYLDQLDRGD